MFVKRRVWYQRLFTSPCLVRYEGRAALPHPPVNITWTHISSHPSLKCCELRRSSRRNPNIRRLLAVRSGGAIWGQALQWIVVTSNNQRGAYWRPNVQSGVWFKMPVQTIGEKMNMLSCPRMQTLNVVQTEESVYYILVCTMGLFYFDTLYWSSKGKLLFAQLHVYDATTTGFLCRVQGLQHVAKWNREPLCTSTLPTPKNN